MDKKVLMAGKYTNGARAAWEHWGWQVFETERELPQREDPVLSSEIMNARKRHGIPLVFSFDFSPALSEECHRQGLKYVSWVWDSPHLSLWAKSARYETNYIFVFDHVLYQQMLVRGFRNVWHLPLSADVDDFQSTISMDGGRRRDQYGSDVVFLGNIYNDSAQGLYDQISYLPPYTRGYLDAVMCAQRKLWGLDLLTDGLNDRVWEDLKQYVHWDLGDRYEDGLYELMMTSILGKKVAQLERKEVCSYLARHFDFSLYTGADTSFDPEIRNRGYAGYQTEMPLIFHYSKINIHITIRSITSGVPLRVMDVLACEGFLLTNYQLEIAEYFEDGRELVIYQDFQDMYEKIAYYLEHEEERQAIAHAGYLKVKEQFHYNKQVEKIITVLEEVSLCPRR